MSRIRRYEIVDQRFPPLLIRETSLFDTQTLAFPSPFDEVDDLTFPLDLLNPSPLDLFDSVTDLIQVEKTPSFCSYQRIRRRLEPDFPIEYLCDRISALESKFDRLIRPRIADGDRKYSWTAEIKGSGERKYEWTAEVEGPSNRKYKWAAEVNGPRDQKYKWAAEIDGPAAQQKHKWATEIKGGKKNKEEREVVVKKKNGRWTAEIKAERENGEISRIYKFKTSSGNADEGMVKQEKQKKEKKKSKKKETQTRVVEIEEEEDSERENHRAVVLRQAFARRAGAVRINKGKNRELSPHDAASMIQRTFRAYLIRRSKALRTLRELAVAKTKLKELRAAFNNFNYRRLIARDAEECQKFSEKIIVLLLSVDAIEGIDVMVRAAKKSMVDELEAMLDVVDPQPMGKSLSMRRRTFDMPDNVIRNEIAEGVTQIVQMLEGEE